MPWLVLLIAIVPQFKLAQQKENSIPTAISEIVKNYYVQESIRFDFVVNGGSSEFLALLENVLKGSEAYRVYKVNQKSEFVQDQSAIWVFDTFTNFWIFLKSLSQTNNEVIRNLVYFLQGSSDDIERNFHFAVNASQTRNNHRLLGREKAQLWSFLITENNGIVLKSFMSYTPKQCGKLQLMEINKFSKTSLQWTTKNYFAIDMFNFHGCQLVFSLVVLLNSTYQLGHHELTIVEAAAKSLNYSVLFNPYLTSLNGNKSFFKFPAKPVDLSLKILEIVYQKYQQFHFSMPYLDTIKGLTVPYGEPFTPLEKLFWPFDHDVWILFILSFVIATCAIYGIKLFLPKHKSFVFGSNVSTPVLNVVMIFMGGGMMVLPRRNFARYILMCFILYCLVIRSKFI